jgi:hypothetical protein
MKGGGSQDGVRVSKFETHSVKEVVVVLVKCQIQKANAGNVVFETDLDSREKTVNELYKSR